jgi:hypothetical protein
MVQGNVMKYLEQNPQADRRLLVRMYLSRQLSDIHNIHSYQTLLSVYNICTLMIQMSFTAILKGFVF